MSSDRQPPTNYYPYTGQPSSNLGSFPSQNPSSNPNMGVNNGKLQNNLSSFQTSYQLDPNQRSKNRPMYSSTIQFSESKSETKSGFNLESMGRAVHQPSKYEVKQTSAVYQTNLNSNNENRNLFDNYAKNKPKDPKMFASSFISNPTNTQGFDRFPAFNLNSNGNKESPGQQVIFHQNESVKPAFEETPEEKRKRQIMDIKKQLDAINIKMTQANNTENRNHGSMLPQQPAVTREKPQGISQSYIFPSNTASNFSEPLKRNEQNGGISALDKLYQQKKNKPKIFEEPEIPTKKYEPESYKFEKPNLYTPTPQTQNTKQSTFTFNERNYYKSEDEKKPQTKEQYIYTPSTPKIIITKQNTSENQDPTSFKKKKNQMMIGQTLSPKNTMNTGKPLIKKMISVEEDIPEPVMQLREFKREDFEIGKKMGKGQFGEVQLVRHKATGFLCAMKVMEKKQIRDENYVGQIARELSIQFYLNHRYVAPLYGYFSDEKNVYLLQEFCEGGQLLEKLRKQRRMEERDVSLIIKQVCEGVDYIHKELIIHRDIKPENILFTHGAVKISDFGWAVYRGLGMRKTASGSPLYYPPEIVKGEEYDDKIDVWNIGMMTYECLLGKIPFRIYTEMDLDRIVSDDITFPEYVDVSDDAKDFILGTMKKKGDQRMEIRKMLRHPFITKQEETRLPANVMEEFKKVLS